MSTNKKISELTELAEASLADDDVLAIVDVSAGETFKVRKDSLASALAGVASLSASTPVAVDQSTGTVTVSLGTVPITKGGTGAVNAPAALAALGGLVDPMSTRGDLLTRGTNGEDNARVPVGTNGQFLTTDGTDVSWGAVPTSGLSGNINLGTQVTGTLGVDDGGTGGSGQAAGRTGLGLGTIATQASDSVNIDGGAIDGTNIGATSRGTGAFTTLNANGGGALTGTWSDLGTVTTAIINGGTITGITDLAVADGGTGASTFTANGVLHGNGTSAIGVTATGTSGQVLTSNGSGSAPTFQAVSAASSNSGALNLNSSVTFQIFTASGTWTKPGSGTTVIVEAWGAGGSGGCGSGSMSGGGGGGGSYARAQFAIGDLGSTETVTIGAGGVLQASADSAGSAGGATSFGSHFQAFGGGAGGAYAGGGGGGVKTIGGNGGNSAGGDGGDPDGGAGGDGDDAPGDKSTGGLGGGGGGTEASASGGSGQPGGSSGFGGGGGGGASHSSGTGGAGGNSLYAGGGGAAGSQSGTVGNGGTSTFGGDGAKGASGSANAPTPGSATGGAMIPGGGGGGSVTGNSGAGAAGKVLVTVITIS